MFLVAQVYSVTVNVSTINSSRVVGFKRVLRSEFEQECVKLVRILVKVFGIGQTFSK